MRRLMERSTATDAPDTTKFRALADEFVTLYPPINSIVGDINRFVNKMDWATKSSLGESVRRFEDMALQLRLAAGNLKEKLDTASRGELVAGRPVKLPKTAREWSMFSDMKGVGAAASEMNAALKLAVDQIKKNLKGLSLPNDERKVAEVLGAAYTAHLHPVQIRHRDFGATDTEVNDRARQALIDVAKAQLGYEGYLPGLSGRM